MAGDGPDIRTLIHELRNVEFGALMRMHLLVAQRIALYRNGVALQRVVDSLRMRRQALDEIARAARP